MKDTEIVKAIVDHGLWIMMDDQIAYHIQGEEGVETNLKALTAALEIFLEEKANSELIPPEDEPVFTTGEPAVRDWGYIAEEVASINEKVIEDPVLDDEFNAGKKYAQKKISKLLDEVEEAYKDLARAEKMDSEASRIPKAQLNAIKFAKSWLASGGQVDNDGDRVCLPW